MKKFIYYSPMIPIIGYLIILILIFISPFKLTVINESTGSYWTYISIQIVSYITLIEILS